MGKFTNHFNRRLEITDRSRYHREQYQSYMTGPEWRNVEMAEELGAFLREGRSLFQFPYFRQIAELWKVIYRSFASARKHDSFSSIFFSEYMMMDIFVGVFTTFELLPRAILSLLFYPFFKTTNHTPMQAHIASFYEKYAHDLQTIPFYDHKYLEIRADLTQKYHACKNRTWLDWLSFKTLSAELWARHWISKPLSAFFHQEDNQVPATTDILVKFRDKEHHTAEEARAAFKDKIALLSDEYQINIVDDQLYVKEQQPNKPYLSVYARLSVPRYMAFQNAVHVLADEEIFIRKIAGQDHVQVKCVVDAKDKVSLKLHEEELRTTKKVKPLYTYVDDIHPNRRFSLFDVPVRNLHKTIDRLEKQDDVEVKFIHNF